MTPAVSAASLPVIRFTDVGKRYGTQDVLRGVSLQVNAGEFFCLVGVNGAGKSTLIKCLLDFASADTGEIHIGDVSSTEPRARAPLAYLPEKFTPPYYLGGGDFLAYMCALHGTPLDRSLLDELLGVVDLVPEALAKPVRALSKGMAQKLGILACLLSGKSLLVLDEPMSGLDPKARARIRDHLWSLRERGCTVFFSSHLLSDVESLCDRVAILHGGRLQFTGTPAECRARFGAPDFEQAFLACIGAGASVPLPEGR